MKKLLTITIFSLMCFLGKAQSLKIDVNEVHFYAYDTTLVFEYRVQIDTLGFHFESKQVSRKFDLKVASERDSLNNNPLIDAVLTRMGVFLSNQFPN